MSSEIHKKRISPLNFLISYKCTNECKHCSLQASPKQDDAVMELGDIRRYLEDVTSNYIIDEVDFFGGEPLLHFNLLVDLIEEAKRFGIPKIGLPTNGFWGKNDRVAKKYAQKLKEAGLTRMGFSIDAFHEEFIPLDVVRGAIRATLEAGIEWVGLVVKYIGSENEKNIFNDRTGEISDVFSKEFDSCQLIKAEICVTGRAANQLVNYYSLETLASPALGQRCQNIRIPIFMVDPHGWVHIQSCHGICIGNAKEKSLAEIIGDFDPRRHPIIGKLVAKGGPKNLLEVAIEKGYEPQQGYADKCHLCFCLRKYLRPFYPNILEPSNIYI